MKPSIFRIAYSFYALNTLKFSSEHRSVAEIFLAKRVDIREGRERNGVVSPNMPHSLTALQLAHRDIGLPTLALLWTAQMDVAYSMIV